MSTFEAFSCLTRVSSSAINKVGLDHFKPPPMGTQQDSSAPLFLLRSDLFFRTNSSLFACMSWTSLWYWAKARLQHGGVLSGSCELSLQCFCPEHSIAVSLERLRFLSGSLHDILQQATTVIRVLSSQGKLSTQG
jgi:hypothetical protein